MAKCHSASSRAASADETASIQNLMDFESCLQLLLLLLHVDNDAVDNVDGSMPRESSLHAYFPFVD